MTEGRDPTTGRLLPGHELSKGVSRNHAPARINIARMARRKAAELGLDVDELVFDVVLTMLLNGARGDTKAAKLALDWLGQQDPAGPLVEVNVGNFGTPQVPPLETVEGGPTSLSVQLKALVRIAEERKLIDFLGATPAQVVEQVANRKHRADLDDLLS